MVVTTSTIGAGGGGIMNPAQGGFKEDRGKAATIKPKKKGKKR